MIEKAGCFLAGLPNDIESIIHTVTECDAAKRSEKESTFSCRTAGCFLDHFETCGPRKGHGCPNQNPDFSGSLGSNPQSFPSTVPAVLA